jgi:hypothetical protein
MSLREKAMLNNGIAKDLAEGFGGRKADYLIRLNRKLKVEIAFQCNDYGSPLAEVA